MGLVGKRLRSRTRAMRKMPTRAEGRMRSWLRDRRFLGYKFRRQHPIGNYILDFYCAELQLAIELDGSHHESSWMNEYDSTRSGHCHDSSRAREFVAIASRTRRPTPRAGGRAGRGWRV